MYINELDQHTTQAEMRTLRCVYFGKQISQYAHVTLTPCMCLLQVRDWLALTFTRSMSKIKQGGADKPRFRSVANAIRAGILVDK